MAFQPAANCVEAVIHATLHGQSCLNTFYYKKDTTPTQEDVEEIADDMDAAWAANILPLLSEQYIYNFTSVRGLSASEDVYAENAAHSGAGAVSSPSLPNNVALALKRRSAYTGRAARGRIYIGGISEASYDAANQSVIDTFGDAMAAALNTIDDAFRTVDIIPVILHRVSAGVPLPAAVIFTLVEWTVVDYVLDSMRRRLPGRGST